MTDVSKTNELIAEARGTLCRDHYTAKEAKSLALQLADALEAATRVPVQGEPTPINGKWVCGKCAREVAQGHDDGQFPEHHRTCPKRGSVQGEPNDDRTPEFEAIEQELFKHQPLLSMQDGSIRGCKCMDRVFVTKTEDWGTHLAEVFTRLSRATVPDAATAALRRVAAVRLLTGFTDAELGELGGFEEETE